jgi:hypothetical protein
MVWVLSLTFLFILPLIFWLRKEKHMLQKVTMNRILWLDTTLWFLILVCGARIRHYDGYFLLSCTCRPWPTYRPLQEVVPGDRRIAWPAGDKELSPDINDPIQPTAANAFVHVIMTLRKTFIQDSVLMMELYPLPSHGQPSIFSDPAFLSLKSQVNIIALECGSMLTLIC